MSKRGADKQLTKDNWDADETDECDQASVESRRQVASDEVIQRRVIKKAQRRLNRNTDREAPAVAKPFAMFSGFASSSTTAPLPASSATGAGSGGAGASNPFANLAALGAKSDSSGNKPAVSLPLSTAQSGGAFCFASSGQTPASGAAAAGAGANSPLSLAGSAGAKSVAPSLAYSAVTGTAAKNGTTAAAETTTAAAVAAATPVDAEYRSQVGTLNRSLVDWLQQHVSASACCLLTPVFDDYAVHLARLQQELRQRHPTPAATTATSSALTSSLTVASSAAPALTSHSFGAGFSFVAPGACSAASTTSSGAPFSTSASQSSGFGAGFFGFAKATGEQVKTTDHVVVHGRKIDDTEEVVVDDESPPVPVVTTVKEPDALYSIRCKLFYKKDGAYTEKGVGVLHLKSTDGKHQLLIRADTNLGNVLLNIQLNSSIPSQRVGKNNVMLVCVPHPPLAGVATNSSSANNNGDDSGGGATPVPLLIRVKSSADADQLLAEIDQLKQQ